MSKGDPLRRTQAERRASSEERLLAAAAELIVERGIQRTSLADIGERAGFSRGLVNHCFGSKTAMVERLTALVDEHFTVRAQRAIGDRTGFDALAATVGLYVDLVAGSDVFGRAHVVLWAESITHVPELAPSRLAWDRYFRAGLAQMIADGAEAGSIRADVDAAATALVIVGMLRGVVMQRMLDPELDRDPLAAAPLIDLLRAMLQPPPST